jgi:hypothetical protein
VSRAASGSLAGRRYWKKYLTGMDRIDRIERSAGCGMMNDELKTARLSSFITQYSALIIS